MSVSTTHHDKLQSGIRSLLDEVSRFINAKGPPPTEESIAAIEMTQYSKEVQTVCSQGCLLAESVADHVFAISRLLEPPQLTISPWTSVRSALEAAAYGCWLMDPSIGVRDRIARSFAFRYDGLLHQKKAARSMGDDQGLQHAEARIQTVAADAHRLGFEEKTDKKGRVVGMATNFPSSTECIQKNLLNESGYRILSSVAHSHPSSLISVSFTAKDEEAPLLLSKHISISSICWLLMTASDAFSAVVWRQASYFGYDLNELHSMLSDIYDMMGIRKDRRLWGA